MASYLVETEDGKKYQVDTEDQPSDATPTPGSTPTEASHPLDKIAKMGKSIAPSLGGAIGASTGLGLVGEMAGRAVQAKPEETLNAAPTVLGALGAATGGPVGAGVLGGAAEGFKQVDLMAMGKRPIPKSLDDIAKMGQSMNSTANTQSAGALIGEGVNKASEPLIDAGINFGMRATGNIKSLLYNSKSYTETLRKIANAEKASQSMLENGAIPFLGSPTKMATNVQQIMGDAGKQMNTAISQAESSGVAGDAPTLAKKISDELSTKYDNQKAIVDKINEDIKANGDGPLSIRNLQELKNRWAGIGFDRSTIGTDVSKYYRKAAMIADQYITDNIASASADAAKSYTAAKSLYGDAYRTMGGVAQKLTQELGNNLMGLPTYAIGAGHLAAGNIPEALATMGVLEGVRRRGSAAVANSSYGLGEFLKNNPTTPAAGVGISEIIRRAKEYK